MAHCSILMVTLAHLIRILRVIAPRRQLSGMQKQKKREKVTLCISLSLSLSLPPSLCLSLSPSLSLSLSLSVSLHSLAGHQGPSDLVEGYCCAKLAMIKPSLMIFKKSSGLASVFKVSHLSPSPLPTHHDHISPTPLKSPTRTASLKRFFVSVLALPCMV